MPQQQFGNFTASELYCPKCKSSQPVREHLLLVLPSSGELYEFRCSNCATSLGKRTVTGPTLPPAQLKPRRRPVASGRKLLRA